MKIKTKTIHSYIVLLLVLIFPLFICFVIRQTSTRTAPIQEWFAQPSPPARQPPQQCCPKKKHPLEHRGPILFEVFPKVPVNKCSDDIESNMGTITPGDKNTVVHGTFQNTACVSVLGHSIGQGEDISDCQKLAGPERPHFAFQDGNCFANISANIVTDPLLHQKAASDCTIYKKPYYNDYSVRLLQ